MNIKLGKKIRIRLEGNELEDLKVSKKIQRSFSLGKQTVLDFILTTQKESSVSELGPGKFEISLSEDDMIGLCEGNLKSGVEICGFQIQMDAFSDEKRKKFNRN